MAIAPNCSSNQKPAIGTADRPRAGLSWKLPFT